MIRAHQRAYLRRNWLRLYAALLVVLAVNIWVQVGGKVLLILAATGAALSALIAAEFLVSGHRVAKHSLTWQAAITGAARRRAVGQPGRTRRQLTSRRGRVIEGEVVTR